MAPIIIIATNALGGRDPRRVDAEFSGVWGAAAVSLLGGDAERFGSLVYVQSPLDGDLAGGGHQSGVFGFNMLGDALRDLLDPRLRGSQLLRR